MKVLNIHAVNVSMLEQQLVVLKKENIKRSNILVITMSMLRLKKELSINI